MKSKWLTATGLALGVVLLLAVNVFSNRTFTSVRLDLTQNKLYTLSEGTRNVLSALDEPITLRLFLSRGLMTRLPSTNSYAKRAQDLLEEYQRAAGGKLLVNVIDAEPFSEEEDRAVGYGLHGIPLDEESIFYFGLVATDSTDEEEAIPYLSTEREEFLEYDITRLIHQVAHPKQKVVGLISSLPIEGINPQAALMGRPPEPWMVLTQMRQLFEVRTLDNDITEVPEDVDVLMLVHPKELSDQTLYAIDQFILRGGRALVFVDPHAEADQGGPASLMGMGPSGRSSELGKLLAVWGLELVRSKVIGDLQWATKVRFQREGRLVLIDYPVWINLPPALFNQEDIVTAKLGNLALATAGRLRAKTDASVRVTPLIQSTPNAMQIDTERLGLLHDPQDILRNYRPEGERFILAARVTGPVNSAFPDGPPPAKVDQSTGAKESENIGKEDDTAKREHLANSKGDINVIVVADTDLLQDQFWVQVQQLLGTRIAIPSAANGTFVVNALDSLAGSNDLISIRSRGRFSRPFTRVNALRQEAELHYREKEQQLIQRLEEAEQNLTELERSKQGDNAVILSEAQQQEIARFREEKIQIRKELRNVRHELRKNIESLEGWMKFVSIGMMPVLIGIGGIVVGSYQVRRRKRGVIHGRRSKP